MSILFSQKLLNHNEIRPQEADFTEVLASIAVVPKMLYFYGKMPKNRLKSGTKKTHERPPTIAIVGTRKPTKYGEAVAYKLAMEAAKRGAVVVSGMAYGIDSIAHRGALDAGGVTVAVLGTSIDRIYPREHIGLAERIIEQNGAILSEVPAGVRVGEEYVKGVKYYPKTAFLQRNRLISGLADVVVVPEAAERSGSLNTAAHALEQGREVFAVPGNIDQPLSRGCNRLIQQGAMPCTGLDDVLRELFPEEYRRKQFRKDEIKGDDALETAILRTILAGTLDGEEIMRETGMEAREFSRTMTILEIKGRIRALGGNRWCLS